MGAMAILLQTESRNKFNPALDSSVKGQAIKSRDRNIVWIEFSIIADTFTKTMDGKIGSTQLSISLTIHHSQQVGQKLIKNYLRKDFLLKHFEHRVRLNTR